MKKGSKHTEESKRKISEAKKGSKHSEGTKAKISEALEGRKLSEVTKRRMSKASRGRKLSEVTKRRMKEARRKRFGDPVTRFWSRVDKSKNDNDCWNWIGYTRPPPRDYGVMFWEGREQQSHRVAYQITYGPISEGAVVMHTCDNKRCVNPEHLTATTQLANIRDAVLKGRLPTGEQASASKLTEEQVIEIRRLAASGASHWTLSRDYNVVYGTIGRIVRRESWRYIKEE